MYMFGIPKIIYNDSHVIIIEKPAGMPSVSLSSSDHGTLASWLISRFPEQESLQKGALEGGLVHRLDNDTSGIIIAATNPKSYDFLRNAFASGDVEKRYNALALGIISNANDIDFPITRNKKNSRKMRVCSTAGIYGVDGARQAITHFSPIAFYAMGSVEYTMLDVKIDTGVRHQIRAHLASIGHPLAGDKLYQSKKMQAWDCLNMSRHFLHACFISFEHPFTHKRMKFLSELSKDLKSVMSRMLRIRC